MKKSKPKARTPEQEISQMIGTLAGLEQQLGLGTHFETMAERAAWLLGQKEGLTEDDRKTLENFRLWVDRTHRAVGPWRVKFAAMAPGLFAAADRARQEHKKYHG